jgi:ribosomal protein S18 acetylase RimI-like enzyme
VELRFVSPREALDAFVELELMASAPYVDFLYGDRNVAARIHRRLVENDVGEFAVPHAVLALNEASEPVGMLAGPLEAAELARARLRSASVLIKDPDFLANPSARERASKVREALLQPAPRDAYLSRIAVAPRFQGQGVARRLLDHFFDSCRARGSERAVLEVAPVHQEAFALYQAAGFSKLGEASVKVADRVLTYMHLARPLP